MERKVSIFNFDQDEFESLSDAWEMYKLLLRKCLNHTMSSMEQMTHFISRKKTPTRMFLDVSSWGTLRVKIDDKLKVLIKNMCHNEYHSTDRAMKQKSILVVDLNTTFLAQMEVLSK